MTAMSAAEQMRKWRLNNPEKNREQQKKDNAKRGPYRQKYYADRKESHKEKSLLRSHGITLAIFDQMVHSQNYQCSICKIDLREVPLKNVHVDHCHSSGKIRSVLCSKCNHGLGLFNDDVARLQTAIDYLELHR